MIVCDEEGKTIVFVDIFDSIEVCPKSNNGNCPSCGEKLYLDYGFAGRYGFGLYKYCENESCEDAYKFFDFVKEEG